MSAGFCTDCGTVLESFDGLDRCPACGTTGLPCASGDQVSVSVNWHELRILVMWAENWARQHKGCTETDMSRTVYGIARRLRAQHPERIPLTLAEEMGEIAAEHEMGVTDPKLRQDIAEQTGREVRLERLRRPEGDS